MKQRLLLIASLIGIGLVFSFAFLAGKIATKIAKPVDEAGAVAQAVEKIPAPVPTDTSHASIPVFDWYPVERVVDGDTIVVKVGTTSEKLRLIGLDTPEVVDPRKPVQCFGKEASAEMHKIADGQSVRLEYDPSQGRYDKYGRTLAYAWVNANSRPEGILLNLTMIAEGFGHEYTYRYPYKYQTEFKAAEKTAREMKKGLWADGACE